MKITLTVAEITDLVLSRYDLPPNTVVEIAEYAEVRNPLADRLTVALRNQDCLTPDDDIRPDKKIASIKILRDMVAAEKGGSNVQGNACGLAQAKAAVEDFSKFMFYVRRYGFPNMGSGEPKSW